VVKLGTLDPGGDHLSTFSTDEGLYRVRHPARPGLEYIGETGRSLRGRVRALAHGAFAEEMPYRDPHTAAPCLWAVQQEEAEKLEVSVTTPTLAEDKQSRKAFEDALIAVYRREMGESPTANFGRIIDGYRQSTYRSGEERGGPLEPGQTECNTEDGVGPLDWSRSSDVLSEDWMGLLWSSPRPLADADTRFRRTMGCTGSGARARHRRWSTSGRVRTSSHGCIVTGETGTRRCCSRTRNWGSTTPSTSAKRLRRSLSAFTGWKLGRVQKISSRCHTPLPS